MDKPTAPPAERDQFTQQASYILPDDGTHTITRAIIATILRAADANARARLAPTPRADVAGEAETETRALTEAEIDECLRAGCRATGCTVEDTADHLSLRRDEARRVVGGMPSIYSATWTDAVRAKAAVLLARKAGSADARAMLTGWRDDDLGLHREVPGGAVGPVWVKPLGEGWEWCVVHRGCAVARGTAPTKEHAMDAADAAAARWYTLPPVAPPAAEGATEHDRCPATIDGVHRYTLESLPPKCPCGASSPAPAPEPDDTDIVHGPWCKRVGCSGCGTEPAPSPAPSTAHAGEVATPKCEHAIPGPCDTCAAWGALVERLAKERADAGAILDEPIVADARASMSLVEKARQVVNMRAYYADAAQKFGAEIDSLLPERDALKRALADEQAAHLVTRSERDHARGRAEGLEEQGRANLEELAQARAALARAAGERAEAVEEARREARERCLAVLRAEAEKPSPAWEPKFKHDLEACAECKEWKARKHSIQHACDDWYREFYAYKADHEHATTRWAARRHGAREMLDALLSPPAGDAESEAQGGQS